MSKGVKDKRQLNGKDVRWPTGSGSRTLPLTHTPNEVNLNLPLFNQFLKELHRVRTVRATDTTNNITNVTAILD